MKRVNSFLVFILCAFLSFAQTPQGFNYQSVIRDASADVLSNTMVGVEFKLHKTTTDGTVVYTETHTPTTNAYGVFDLVVGQGTSSDDFSTIAWSSDSYFLEVSVDTTGGTTYSSMGTTQLLSVPYALQAKYVENGDNLGNHTATQNYQTGGNWISNDGDDEGILVNSGGRVTTSHKLFLGSNINLADHWINGDGTDNKGIQFDTDGNVTTSGDLTLGGNFQLNGILTSPSENQIFGTYDNTSNLSNLERRNVILGYQAAEGAQSGDSNVVIGYFAGYNLNGDSNVLIGTAAGAGGTFSNQLHIRDLIYGEFDNNLLQVKGELNVDENIATDGNVIIDQDGDDLRAAGAANNVEMIALIVNTDGTLNSNVTSSSGITSSLSGHVYTVNYNNHFSSIPAVTITCIAANDTSNRVAQITSLGQGKVEYTVENHNGDSITNAMTVLTIIGKR